MGAKVAIVAGGGGPTGRATAMALAASGLSVVAVDRSEARLGDLPDGVRPEVADTTDPAVTADLVDRIAAEVGPPDVLVNTIGAFGQGDVLSTTPEQLRLVRSGGAAEPVRLPADALFICIGGTPRTDGAAGTRLVTNPAGYLVTGSDAAREPGSNWPLPREPLPLDINL